MKEKKDCKIVQDLLPNYIEKLTNEETNNFIEKHLKECEECQKIYENMKKDFEVNSAKRDDREVKYIKKYNKKLKILKTILLIIILIYVLIIGRRTFIIVSLSEKSKENIQNDNYYAKIYSYYGSSLSITESYNLKGNYLTTITTMANGKEINKLTIYKKGDEKLALSEYNGKKYIQDSDKILGGYVFPITYGANGFFANLQCAFIDGGIDSTHCNGKECYVIKGKTYDQYIDKKTGIVIRELEKSTSAMPEKIYGIKDFEYKFNTVKDSDIVKPDTTGYIVNQE